MQNPLWDYASDIYALEGVASACVALQDQHGLDVNLLLYAAWLAHTGRRLKMQHLSALDASVSEWRDQVVRPLRAVRRQLHGRAGVSELYGAVKALELRAEREQLDAMYAFFAHGDALPGARDALRDALRDNLQVVAQFYCPGEEPWVPAISDLAARISPEPGVAPGRSG